MRDCRSLDFTFRPGAVPSVIMSRVEEIQQAIASLSLEERAELMSSLMNFEDDEWDKQMKRDAAAGKFDKLDRQTDADIKAGQTLSLDDVINGQ